MSKPNTPATKAAPVVQDGELDIPKLGQDAAQASAPEHAGPDLGAGHAAKTGIETSPLSAAEVAAMRAEIASLSRQLHAQNNPVVRSGTQELHSLQPDQVVDIPATGSLEEWAKNNKRHDLVQEMIDPVASMDHAAHLLFNEELMVINIPESGNPADENPVPVWNNGRSVFITRGRDEVVKRKYVEQLLRAKPLSVQTKVVRDGDGEVFNRTVKTSALKYPVNIVRDDNPNGRAWARKILTEG